MKNNELQNMIPMSDELTEEDLMNVTGGCKCGGFHGAVNNFIGWLFGLAGINFTCGNCGD